MYGRIIILIDKYRGMMKYKKTANEYNRYTRHVLFVNRCAFGAVTKIVEYNARTSKFPQISHSRIQCLMDYIS